MRSLRKEREETREVLYLEGKEKEEKEGAGFKVQLKWGSLLFLSGVQRRDVPVHHCHCSLLRCLHKLTMNLGDRHIGVVQTSTNQVMSFNITLKRERSLKSLCAVVSVGSSRDDWSSSFQSRSCPRICSSGAAFSATPTCA